MRSALIAPEANATTGVIKSKVKQRSVLSCAAFSRSERLLRETSSLCRRMQRAPYSCRVSFLPWTQLQEGIAYISISSDLYTQFWTSATIRLLHDVVRCFICFRYWSRTDVDMVWLLYRVSHKVGLFIVATTFLLPTNFRKFFHKYTLQEGNFQPEDILHVVWLTALRYLCSSNFL